MSEGDIRLRLYLALFAVGEKKQLLDDVGRIEKMVDAFLAAPPLGGLTTVKVGDNKPKPLTDKTRTAFAAKRKDTTVEYFDQEGDDRCAWADFNLCPGIIEIRSVVERGVLLEHRATALDDLIAACVRVAEVWSGKAIAGEGHIKIEYGAMFEPPYARLRRPHSTMRYPERSLVTFLDPRHKRRADDFKALTEPKPAHAKITKHGDLVEIRWAKTLDEEDVAQASTWHHCWTARVATELDDTWNEHGDEKVLAGNGEARAPLTFYNPWWKRAFMAVPVSPKGELQKAAWDKACKVLKAGAVPSKDDDDDGKIDHMWIVVPKREQAIAVHDRVVAAGFMSAAYPDADVDDEFWDPVPRGPWLEKSTDNGKPAR